ncbi:hypothetical protein LX36DRAFT_406442 [Colletotrichum falcatum]|nr:hypothetical protein LX36DRAFT_406442 [Colletotrichum falcatum]
MRRSLLFFLAPAAALCDTRSAGYALAGPYCCNREGTADPSGTCKGMGLNAYACESIQRNDAPPNALTRKGGCDALELFPVGRDIKGFVANSNDSLQLGPTSAGDFFLAFVGCAE